MLNGVVHVEAFWLGWHGSTLGLPEVANFSAVMNDSGTQLTASYH
jgi:hypothetical protein